MPSAHNLSGSLISLCRYQIEFADVIPDVIPQVRALCPFISVVPKGRPPAGWPGFAGPCFRPSGVACLGAIAPFAACGAPNPTAAKPKVAPSPSEMRCARVVSSVVACRVRCEWQSENYELDKNAQKLLDKARISVQEWLMHRFGSSR